jgi:A/G-specific adenine glycosylase
MDLMITASNRTAPNEGKSAARKVSDTVPDIEELCSLCAPIPRPLSVESFPMKAEKKKAREETDTVRVVEWRRGTAPSQRWFILIKRPEGGVYRVLRSATIAAADEPCVRTPWRPRRISH